MKKNILIIAVLTVIIGITAVVGLNTRNAAPKVDSGTETVISLGEKTLQPLQIPSSHQAFSWLIASACAEEAPAEEVPAESTESAVSADSAETADPSQMSWQEMRDYVLNLAPSYLYFTVGQQSYGPYPLTDELDLPITQPDGQNNVLHVTPTSVVMADSNCEGQDCVQQGEVTLENMSDRILGNMILCLPNQVYVELYSAEQMADALLGTTDPALAEEAAQ